MGWKRFSLASLLGIIALPAGFYLARAVLILWYTHTDPHSHDAQISMGIFYASLYIAVLCGLVAFGVGLMRGRQRPKQPVGNSPQTRHSASAR